MKIFVKFCASSIDLICKLITRQWKVHGRQDKRITSQKKDPIAQENYQKTSWMGLLQRRKYRTGTKWKPGFFFPVPFGRTGNSRFATTYWLNYLAYVIMSIMVNGSVN